MSDLEDILKQTLENIKATVDTDNIIGKPVTNGDGVVILPVSKVSYGFVIGGGEYSETNPKAKQNDYPHASISGGGVTVTPIGFLVCGRDKKFISVEKTDEGNKWLDLIKATINTMKSEDK